MISADNIQKTNCIQKFFLSKVPKEDINFKMSVVYIWTMINSNTKHLDCGSFKETQLNRLPLVQRAKLQEVYITKFEFHLKYKPVNFLGTNKVIHMPTNISRKQRT